jgi:tryptophanyl-tRNA synthetase
MDSGSASARPRVFSGIQPTGTLHLGNLLGAVLRWPELLDTSDSVFAIVDLHAVTLPIDPKELQANTLNLAATLIACGLDPERCTLFVQSHVAAHAELGWIMQCIGSFGELSRMVQFKDKRDRAEFVSAGLFTYPALQAADILAYDTDEVPVGDDQRQHIELARDIAERLNGRYGPIVKVPRATLPLHGARVMDLQDPAAKMSKSSASDAGLIAIDESPASITKKFKRAVTDSESEVRYDPVAKPGVSNLLAILAAATGQDPAEIAASYPNYGSLKTDTAEAVVALLEPIQRRYDELREDPAELHRSLAVGADKARAVSTGVRDRVFDAMGFVAPKRP